MAFAMGLPLPTLAQNVLTQHNDSQRTGANLKETTLTPTSVNVTSFGKLFSQPVDGYVVSQPLYMAGVPITGKGAHNVVFVATEHDSVYAFDADSNTGANASPLWQVSLIPAGGSTVPSSDVGSGDIVPEIGITGTPVIDGATGTLYVVAKTQENGNYVQRLHALDIRNGSEKFGGPVVIQGSVPGTGDASVNGVVTFNPLRHMQRPALLLNNGLVYIGFSSHGDNVGAPDANQFYPEGYHGWVFAYNATTLKQVAIHNTTPNARTDTSGYPLAGGGIWMAGGGLAADAQGSVYFETGNGTFSADPAFGNGKDFGDSFVKLNGANLSVQDWFSPYDQDGLNRADADLGSGGLIVLPDSVGSAQHPHLLVGCGKEGKIYLLDRDNGNMGHFHTGDDSQIVQGIPNAVGGTWSKPAYFNGNIYYLGNGDVLKAFSIGSGQLSLTPVMQSSLNFAYPGATPSISANGNANGIVWVIQPAGQAVLHAYDASDLTQHLYDSSQTDGRDDTSGYVKFTVPTVANGKVFVGSQYQINVFGAGKWVARPQIAPNGGNFFPSVTVSISDTTSGATIHYTTDGSEPTAASPVYSSSFVVANTLMVKAKAFAAGYAPSATASATFLIDRGPGDGDGLMGQYYNDPGDGTFFNTLAATQVDPTVNIPNGTNIPAPGVGPDNWSARWTGWVQPRFTGPITFATNSDDGVRLWVDNQQIINNWTYHGLTQDTATISLNAGQKYAIKLEFFQGGGDSAIQLFWSYAGLPLEIIPQTQLYSGAPLKAKTPQILPRSGTFSSSVTVTITTQTSAADIRYTLDGTEPTPASALYSGPRTLTQTAIVKAKVFKSGLTPSDTALALFTKNSNAPIYRINCGGGAEPPYAADNFFTGGEGHSRVGDVDVSKVVNPAPLAVYQAERFSNQFGDFSYTLPGLMPNQPYLVRLHFEDSDFTQAGQRVFGVNINGPTYLSNYDIIEDAGGPFIAVVKEFVVPADASGNIVLTFFSLVNYAKISAIEVYPANALKDAGLGTGDGLAATYFDNINFTGTTVHRVDPTINFDWGAGSPDPAIGPDTFSARWTGLVQPRFDGEYTFHTISDDGIRVWVDGQQVLNAFVDQPPTWHNGAPIPLVGGQKYLITVEYYENMGGAVAQLFWSGTGQPVQIVPQSQLYSKIATSISGKITLHGCVNSVQQINFEFRPTDGSAKFVITTTLAADGSFKLNGIPAKAYQIAIKGSKWLQKDVNADTTDSDLFGLTATLLPGDINGDNRVDITDLGLLADSFGKSGGQAGFNPKADLNCDNKVNITDLGLLADSFGKTGDP
jgi:hypothetical protein